MTPKILVSCTYLHISSATSIVLCGWTKACLNLTHSSIKCFYSECNLSLSLDMSVSPLCLMTEAKEPGVG